MTPGPAMPPRDTAAPAPPPADGAHLAEGEPLQRLHLRRFSRWIALLLLGYGLLDAAMVLAYRDAAIAVCGVVFLLASAGLLWVSARTDAWGTERASAYAGSILLALAVLIAVAYPDAASGLTIVPLGGLALLMPYQRRERLVRFMVLAGAASLLVAILSVTVRPWTRAPRWLVDLYTLSAVGIAVAVFLLLLWQFHDRLSSLVARLTEEAHGRRLAAEALAVRDEAITASIAGMAFADGEGRLTDVNPAFLRLWGYDRPEEIVGRPAVEFWEDPSAAAEVIAGIGAHGSWLGELVARRRDGSRFECQVAATLVRGAESGAAHLMGAFLDVTARKESERERALLADIVTASHEELYLFDAGTLRFLFANEAALTSLGYGLDELRERTPLDLHEADSAEPYRARLEGLVRGDRPVEVFECEHRRADGSLYAVEEHVQLFRRAEGPVFLAIVQDVTERRKAQERQAKLQAQLLQAQKMESVGRLAGGVAHDFNNVLTVILSNLALARRELERGSTEELPALLDDVGEAAVRARDLTRQLLAFGRKQILEMRPLDLNEVIRNFGKMLTRIIGEDVAVSLELAKDLGKVRVDPVQIEQIVLNLAVNARDAMTAGGRLSIRTEDVVSGGDAPGDPVGGPGRWIQLTVSDTGCGMDAETQRHAFEPFYTTKSAGKGSGLGLATVFGIVQQHGGFIRLHSAPGRGATFQLLFPRLEEAETGAAEARPEPAAVGGTETILLVEDEPAVRKALLRALGSAGYRLLDAGDAAEAFRKAAGAAIDLLVTDVIIPGLSGREVHERLSADRPGMKTLFISGYAEDVISDHGVLLPGIHFLQKPFPPAALLAKVREVLAGGEGSRDRAGRA